MRTRIGHWTLGLSAAVAAVILSGSLATKLPAQVSERTTTPADHVTQPNMNDRAMPADKVCKASELIGLNVRGVDSDDDVGSIKDLVIGSDGRVKYAAVSFGGFLGMGDKLFAVPFQAIDFVKTGNDHFARIDVTEATLKEKHGFNQDHWPTEADRSFANDKLRRQAAAPGAVR